MADEKFTAADGKTASKNKGDVMEHKPQSVGRPKAIHLKRRNVCNIISNRFEMYQDGSLPHNKIDEEKITTTFSWLNFEINKSIELTSDKIKDNIIEMSKEDHSDYDCFVLFLLSHGNEKREIQGVDCDYVNIDWIIDKFVTASSLQGIPKLFFIQACRGNEPMKAVRMNEDGDLVRANVKVVLKAQKADTFVFYSTTQGNTAWLGTQQGSFFISKLCQVLQEYCGDETLHLGDITVKVNDILSTHVMRTKQNQTLVQVSEVSHTLTSHLYFHPKGTYEEFMNSYQG